MDKIFRPLFLSLVLIFGVWVKNGGVVSRLCGEIFESAALVYNLSTRGQFVGNKQSLYQAYTQPVHYFKVGPRKFFVLLTQLLVLV